MHILTDDVYIYHAHTIFPLSLLSVGTHEHSSTSQSHELTKRALDSNDGLGFTGMCLQPFPSRKDYVHLFYMALTWLWLIVHYTSYTHIAMFTLHDMLISMPLPCIFYPCLASHMTLDSHICMCICKLGGDITCHCHVCFVPHANDQGRAHFNSWVFS